MDRLGLQGAKRDEVLHTETLDARAAPRSTASSTSRDGRADRQHHPCARRNVRDEAAVFHPCGRHALHVRPEGRQGDLDQCP